MRRFWICLSCCFCSWTVASAMLSGQDYRIQHVGALETRNDGYGVSHLEGISGNGFAVGQSTRFNSNGVSTGTRGVIWDKQQLIDVGNLGVGIDGKGNSGLIAVNQQGVAIGAATKYDSHGNNLGIRGIVWDGGQLHEIEGLGLDSQGRGYSTVTKLSEIGAVIGSTAKYDSSGVFQGYRGIYWDRGQASEIVLRENSNGSSYSRLNDVNSRGIAVGVADVYLKDDSRGQRGIVWNGQELIEIPTLSETDPKAKVNLIGYSELTAINNNGVAIGVSTKIDLTGQNRGNRGIIWDGQQLVDVGTLGTDFAGNGFSALQDLNEVGMAVGRSTKYDLNHDLVGTHGIVWNGQQLVDVGNLGVDVNGIGFSELNSINSSGQAIGRAEKYDAAGNYLGSRGVFWDGQRLVDVGTIGHQGLGWSDLGAINDEGYAIGRSERIGADLNSQGMRGIVWDGQRLHEMQGLGLDRSGYGYSTVDMQNGTIFGAAESFDSNGDYLGQQAFLWDKQLGQVFLKDLFVNELGWDWSRTHAILGANQQGQLVGYAEWFDGQTWGTRGFIISPQNLGPGDSHAVPEPVSLAVWGAAALIGGVGGWQVRRRRFRNQGSQFASPA